MRNPDFSQMLKVMNRQEPDRPVLYELFMNMPLYELINGEKLPKAAGDVERLAFVARAFAGMGYDYSSAHASSFGFPHKERASLKTLSLNEGFVITDERSYEEYEWMEPADVDTGMLAEVGKLLPEGMKVKVMGPGGVLENVIGLTGYDNLCFMMYENPKLVRQLFDDVGSRLVKYYELALQHECVGMVSSNDDWGFNTQTFLTPAQMRQYVIPWHKAIVNTCHKADRPVLLHSCGNMRDVIDDVIAIGFDAKHSYEDNIMPVEEAYEAWHDRITLLGGIDVDFICTKSVEEVSARCHAMLERVKGRGGYALGTGNSVPEYIPLPQFMALIEAATGENPLKGK